MKKEFSKFEIAAIKRTAQTCAGMIAKFDKLSEKIAILQAEKESIERQIAQWDAPIVEMTGYHIMDLVSRERIKTGKDIFGSKWVLQYPETVVPIKHTDIDDSNTTSTTQPDPQQEEVVEEQTQENNELDDEKITF